MYVHIYVIHHIVKKFELRIINNKCFLKASILIREGWLWDSVVTRSLYGVLYVHSTLPICNFGGRGQATARIPLMLLRYVYVDMSSL
jgi:hypothetical protein